MKSPIVSVIIPVYNNEKYIKETIESVLNQTFTDFELLLIEDCSTDNTLECIRNIEDERIRLYQNDENKGIAYTRNVGLKKAVGQYIALIDGDDIMTPERLQMQLNLLTTNPHIDCCAGQGVLINAKSEEIGSLNKVSGDLNLILIFQNVVINPSLTFRKSIIYKIGYYEDYSPAEDYHFILKAVFNEFHFFNMTEILIKYRVHDSNASGNIKSLTNAENRIVSYIFTSLKYPKNSKSTAIHTSIIQQNYTCALIYEIFPIITLPFIL